MQASSIESSSVIHGYQPPVGVFDEMLDSAGHVRPVWERLVQGLDRLGINELKTRDEQLNRLIHENGITYNVYQSDESAKRPWMMDLLPTLLEYNEWRWIETALQQRVDLFNRILSDVYGEQHLLKQRSLPASLVFNNPSFLRACHGITPPNGTYIHLYAADLARSPDGRWWVLSDRLETPAGIGYTLENRFITSHVLPEVFRQCGVMRLQPFFQTMRESFERLVRRKTEQPSIVMLTSGPANESYYEQSFLARNLGYPLVEGADLAVRDHCVYLKTVGGMERVDVILRRVESDYCDPLELRDDSLLGIPGLVHAARVGNVVIANSLGAGFLQTPALAAFLPTLCKQMLNTDLIMPSAATWWCGQEIERQYVLDNLPKLVIKPVFRKRYGEAVFGQLASPQRLQELREAILREPEAWCAQEQVAQATTPIFDPNNLRFTPRHFLLRVFLVATENGYTMMPGGLTRITSDLSTFSVSVQEGGQSQDTWMLSEGQQITPDIALPNTGAVSIRRQTSELPSRAADNVYWLGRYLERSENTLRIVRMLSDNLIQEGSSQTLESIAPFLDLLLPEELSKPLLPETTVGPLFPEKKHELDVDAVEKTLTRQLWDPSIANSLVLNLGNITRTAFIIKERLSVDMWHALNKIREVETEARRLFETSDSYATHSLSELILALSSICGGISENMTRAHDWNFLEIGRRIERGVNLAALLQNTLVSVNNHSRPLLNNLLIASDSSYTYRGRYLTNMQFYPVLDLLIADDTNPRSLVFQIQKLRKHLQALPHPEGEEPFSRFEKIGLRAYTRLRLADLKSLANAYEQGQRRELDQLMLDLMDDLSQLSTLLGQLYFAHGETGALIKV